jgi:SAM-dependent methyltransferase
MAEYRWNLDDFALAYDESAHHIHPHYLEIQDEILDLIDRAPDEPFLAVDAGGGSGRLMAKLLERWPNARGVVVDQSPAFLAIAERRLAPFDGRGLCLLSQLQEDWLEDLPEEPWVVVSMSAIHHLTPDEKHALHQRIHHALVPGGLFLNGDEVRPSDDATFLRLLDQWAAGMGRGIEQGRITPLFRKALDAWVDRNIAHFGEPKQSGDDNLQTLDDLLADYHAIGYHAADAPWHKELWAVMRARKAI